MERRGAPGPLLALVAVLLFGRPLESTIIVRDPGGLTAETAALILSGQQGGELAMEAIAAPLSWANESVTVGLFVEVAGRDLIFGQDEEQLRVDFLVYAIAGEASVRGYVMQTFELDLGRYGEALAAGGLKFSGQLDLPPGEYSLAVMARTRRAGGQVLGLRRVELSVPAPDAHDLILQPRLSGSEDAWINTFQVRTAPEEGGVSRARLREAALKTSAKPVLRSGSSVEVLVSGFGVSPPSGAFSFELLDGRGEVVGSWASTLHEPEEAPGDRPGLKRLTGSIDLSGELQALVAGEYLLRAKAPGESGAPVYSPTLPVIVAGDTGGFSTWAAVNRLETLDEPVGKAELPSAKKRTKLRAKDVKALKKRYAAILGLSTGRDRATAPRALRSYEQGAVTEFGERGLPSLVAAEMGLIKGLGKEDPEALIPVARLHHQAYREHRSRRAFLLATHARNLALAIVELYIDGGTSEESERGAALRQKDERRVVASRLLASFGGDLQRAGLRRFSERLFRRALECDDKNEAALLGMGASFEKYSEYEEAAKYFERLVAARPESGEGRLRLGINHRRLGRKAKARKQLLEVAEGSHARWVRSLAYQELVQMQLEAGEMTQAEDLLNRALERFPDEPKLYLQLAYLRNAVGEPWRAQAELDRLSGVREPEVGDSPRYAYSNWPVDALDRVWARSEEDVLSRLEALRAVLPAGAEGGAP